MESLGEYEVIFDFEEQRYYCFIYAINMDEALGIFFINHNNVTYNHVVNHTEV